LFFFFFQAEDGIRDKLVTGVQTCALPISILALHGVLFGRVAYYLESRSRRLADAGAIVLFAVAAATTGVILQNPGATAFVRSWSVGEGLLPAAALCGYVLIASGITTHTTQVVPRVPSWTDRKSTRLNSSH